MINGSYLEVGLLADVTSENNIWIQEVSHHDLLAWQCAYISWCKDEGWKYIYVEVYLAYCSSFYYNTNFMSKINFNVCFFKTKSKK